VIVEGPKDHAIGTLDLAVAPRVGDRGVVDIDGVLFAEIPEGGANEGCAQVSGDPVGYTKAMCNVSYEFCRFFRCYFSNKSDFNPLGEFIDGD
jgi:hypothetical protein